MKTPSATTVDSQYAAVVRNLATALAESGIPVVSAVPAGGDTAGGISWPRKGASPFLVLFETAEDAVARGLSAGELPSRVLAAWVAGAEAVLSRHRERRRQMTLASIGAVLTEPEDFLAALSRRFKGQAFAQDGLTPEMPAWSPWQGLLARQIVAGDAAATRLSGALEAAALPFSARSYDSDDAAHVLQALAADRERLSAELEAMKARFDVELAETRRLLGELEAERALLHEQVSHSRRLTDELTKAADGRARELSEAKARLGELEAERPLLHDQIQHSQRILEESIAAAERQERELSETKLALDDVRRKADLAGREKAKAEERFSAAEAGVKAREAKLEEERKLLREQVTHLQQAAKERDAAAAGHKRELSETKLALTEARDRAKGLEATVKSLRAQASGDKARIETLAAGRQKLLEEFNRLMAAILQGDGLTSRPWVSRRARQIGIVRDCNIVDPDWYLQHHEDVARAGAEPFRHYIDHGVKEGRPPNASFL